MSKNEVFSWFATNVEKSHLVKLLLHIFLNFYSIQIFVLYFIVS